MSLLSNLLKIGGIAAAPFTGGSSLLATGLGAAGDVASVLGKQQQGAAQGKAAQEQANLSRDRNAIDLYQAQQAAQNQAGALDLQRKNFASADRGNSAKQALIGALLGGGVTPTSISHGQASGGLLRTLNGNPDALAAMKLLGQQAGTAQQAPPSFTGGTIMQAPQLSQPQQIDNGGLLDILARIGEIGGALSPYVQPKQKPSTELPGGQY